MRLSMLIDQVKQIRKNINIPVVLTDGLWGYRYRYPALEKLEEGCAASGVDGVILPDMPMDEYLEHYRAFLIL